VNQTLQLIYRGSRDYGIASGRNDFCSRHFPYAGENSTSLASGNEISQKEPPRFEYGRSGSFGEKPICPRVCLDQLGELAGPAAMR
jgi:hypothetical protein